MSAKKSTETKVVSNNTSSNRLRRISRHLKNHPNDAQAESALSAQPSIRKKSIEKLGFLKKHKPLLLGTTLTKELVHFACKYERLVRNLKFTAIPKYVESVDPKTKQVKLDLVHVHTSKLSNFKGASNTDKVVA